MSPPFVTTNSAMPWTIPMNPGNLGTETGSTAAFGGSA
jgi:hypothetical protein